MPGFLPFLVGSNTTPQYFNPRADFPIWIVAPRSINGTIVRIQCATTSGASGANDFWGDVQLRLQPTGLDLFTVFSTAPNSTTIFAGPFLTPTPFMRLWSQSSATIINTFTILMGRSTD